MRCLFLIILSFHFKHRQELIPDISMHFQSLRLKQVVERLHTTAPCKESNKIAYFIISLQFTQTYRSSI